MLKYTLIHEEIHSKTGQSITKKAVFQLIDYWEKQIQENIEKFPEILNEINEQRKIQGLKPKKRIDKNIVQQAINNYKNTDANTELQKNGGKQEEKQNKKLASEKHFSMEVQ